MILESQLSLLNTRVYIKFYTSLGTELPVMADKIREVAEAEVVHIKNLTTDAAKSGAYIYPFHVRPPLPKKVHMI